MHFHLVCPCPTTQFLTPDITMNPATSSFEDVMEPETKESVILFAPPLGVGESIRTMSLE